MEICANADQEAVVSLIAKMGKAILRCAQESSSSLAFFSSLSGRSIDDIVVTRGTRGDDECGLRCASRMLGE
jgi:hypothetical protein